MLCGIRQNAFLLSMPYNIGEMTLKDVFKQPEEGGKNIFEIALTKKKYKQLFNDLKKFFLILDLKEIKMCILLMMKRHRWRFDPTREEPFEISRSGIDMFIKCPACLDEDRERYKVSRHAWVFIEYCNRYSA